MNLLIIAGIVIGIVAIAGIAFVNAYATDDLIETDTSTIRCTSCSNSCNAESNCGLATCGAIKGRTCGCGK